MNDVQLDPQQVPARAELLLAAELGEDAPGRPIYARPELEQPTAAILGVESVGQADSDVLTRHPEAGHGWSTTCRRTGPRERQRRRGPDGRYRRSVTTWPRSSPRYAAQSFISTRRRSNRSERA